jgi:hypothetical protein
VTVYATVEQLSAKLQRDLSGLPGAAAELLLEEGSALLRALVPGLDDALAAAPPTVDAVLVRKVLTDAVARVLRNKAGVTSQTVGPESATFSGQAARAELGFLASEIAMITPAVDGLSVGGFAIGSVRLGRPDYCAPYGRGFASEADQCW